MNDSTSLQSMYKGTFITLFILLYVLLAAIIVFAPFQNTFNLTETFNNMNEMNTTSPTLFNATALNGSLFANWTINYTYINATMACAAIDNQTVQNCSRAANYDCQTDNLAMIWHAACGGSCRGAMIQFDLGRNMTILEVNLIQDNSAIQTFELYISNRSYPTFSPADQICSSSLCNSSFENFSVDFIQNVTSAGSGSTCYNQTVNFSTTPRIGQYIFLRRISGPAGANPRLAGFGVVTANFSNGGTMGQSIAFNLSRNMSYVRWGMNRTLYNGSIGLNLSCDAGIEFCDGGSNASGGNITCCGNTRNDSIVWRTAVTYGDIHVAPIIETLNIEGLPVSNDTSPNVSIPRRVQTNDVFYNYSIQVNVTLLDSGAGLNATLYMRLVRNDTGSLLNLSRVLNVSNSSTVTFNFTVNQSGYWIAEVWGNDTLNQISIYRNSSVIFVNNSLPIVNVDRPLNGNRSNMTPLSVNWSSSDNDTVDNLTFSVLIDGVRNISGLTDRNYTIIGVVRNGTHNLTVEVNDSSVLINSTLRNFTIDNLPVEVVNVTNSSGSTTITINASVNKTNMVSIIYGTNIQNLNNLYTNNVYELSGLRSDTLTGLLVNTVYYYVYTSIDDVGNRVNTSIFNATTTSGGGGGGVGGGGGGGGGSEVTIVKVLASNVTWLLNPTSINTIGFNIFDKVGSTSVQSNVQVINCSLTEILQNNVLLDIPSAYCTLSNTGFDININSSTLSGLVSTIKTQFLVRNQNSESKKFDAQFQVFNLAFSFPLINVKLPDSLFQPGSPLLVFGNLLKLVINVDSSNILVGVRVLPLLLLSLLFIYLQVKRRMLERLINRVRLPA